MRTKHSSGCVCMTKYPVVFLRSYAQCVLWVCRCQRGAPWRSHAEKGRSTSIMRLFKAAAPYSTLILSQGSGLWKYAVLLTRVARLHFGVFILFCGLTFALLAVSWIYIAVQTYVGYLWVLKSLERIREESKSCLRDKKSHFHALVHPYNDISANFIEGHACRCLIIIEF